MRPDSFDVTLKNIAAQANARAAAKAVKRRLRDLKLLFLRRKGNTIHYSGNAQATCVDLTPIHQ